VTSEARWIEVVAEVEKSFGRLDIMVSNAGIGISGAVDRRYVAGGLAAADRDQSGRRLPVGEALPAPDAENGGGSIIMMSSLAGLRGAAGLSGYSATKGGVRLFAKSIAMECASAGDRIRVNSVHPGIIDTPIWGKLPTEASGSGRNAPIDPHERAKLADAARPRRWRR
jgi:NAD(P)-dependent dehydrogenase (short-subunit alcohol dehydrogenase family)